MIFDYERLKTLARNISCRVVVLLDFQLRNHPLCPIVRHAVAAHLWLQSTPKSMKGLSKKEGSKRKINMSGSILFSSEMRAVIKARHPDFSLG